MVVIPAGPFFMGVPKWARDGGLDEYPNHEVELDAFAIDTYEVTNGLYLEFIRSTGHRTPSHPTDSSKNLWQGGLMPESIASLPVVNVIGLTPRPIVDGPASGCPAKPNGRRPGEGPMIDGSRGETWSPRTSI